VTLPGRRHLGAGPAGLSGLPDPGAAFGGAGEGVEPAEPGGDEESAELVAVQRDGVCLGLCRIFGGDGM